MKPESMFLAVSLQPEFGLRCLVTGLAVSESAAVAMLDEGSPLDGVIKLEVGRLFGFADKKDIPIRLPFDVRNSGWQTLGTVFGSKAPTGSPR